MFAVISLNEGRVDPVSGCIECLACDLQMHLTLGKMKNPKNATKKTKKPAD